MQTSSVWTNQPPFHSFHTYTAHVDIEGNVRVWWDGQFVSDTPSSAYKTPETNGWVKVRNATQISVNTQNAWQGLRIQFGMNNIWDGYQGDVLEVDYVAVWQPAHLPVGQGIFGGGVSAGTVLPVPRM